MEETECSYDGWRADVRTFADNLAQQPGQFGVEDLCRFLLEEKSWRDRDQVVAYLKDYLEVSEAHYRFHSTWSDLSNMGNVAEYDQREIRKVRELMKTIQKTRQ